MFFRDLEILPICLLIVLPVKMIGQVCISSLEITTIGSAVPTTNIVVANIKPDAMRMDFGEERTVISIQSASQQAQLFHRQKTYQWQTLPKVAEINLPPALPKPTETTFDGAPAKLYSMTNGAACNRIWVAPGARFFTSPSNLQATVSRPPDLRQRQMVGFPFDASNIVVGTEYTMTSPVVIQSIADPENTPPYTTNLTIVLTTKLISIYETNFPASEFAIPKDYLPGDGPPPITSVSKTNWIPPDFNVSRQAAFEALRKDYQNGKPVISWPQGFSNPK